MACGSRPNADASKSVYRRSGPQTHRAQPCGTGFAHGAHKSTTEAVPVSHAFPLARSRHVRQSAPAMLTFQASRWTAATSECETTMKTMQTTRREFLKVAAATGVGTMLPWRRAYASAQSPSLRKFIQMLPGLGPAGIPVATSVPYLGADYYRLTAGEYTQQLHPQLSPTRLWGYADSHDRRASTPGSGDRGTAGDAGAAHAVQPAAPDSPITG